MTSSIAESEYAALLSATGLPATYSLQDLRRVYYEGLLGLSSPSGYSTDNLEYMYYVAQGGIGSQSDMEYASWVAGGGSATKSLSDNKYGSTSGPLPSKPRKNLIYNPRAVSTGQASWQTGSNGVGGVAVNDYATGVPVIPGTNVTTSYRKTFTTAPSSYTDVGFRMTTGAGGALNPVVAGKTYACSVYIRVVSASIKALRVQFGWFTDPAAGTGVGSTFNSPLINNVGTEWIRLSLTMTAPPTAGALLFRPNSNATGAGPWLVGEYLEVSACLMEETDTVKSYFDGDTEDVPTVNYVWDGTPYNSISEAKTRAAADMISPLFAKTIFTVGHRGSGDVWPEHTAPSYAGAFAAAGSGVDGLELSIQRNSTGGSGIWFHMHDIGATGLDRTTNIAGDPKTLTDAQINAGVKVDIGPGAYYLNPANYPNVPKFLDEMAKYFGKTVIFLETKDYPAATALLDLLDANFPGYQKSVIWKMHAGGTTQMALARARGMKVWAYLDDPLSIPQLDSIIPYCDYIGVPVNYLVAGGLTDAEIQIVIARGKPVIQWNEPRRWVRDRLKVGGPVTLTNIVVIPAPISAGGWNSNNNAKWAVTYAAGEINVERVAGADALLTASMYNLGLAPGNPTLTGQQQRSIEVWSAVPVTVRTGVAAGYQGGQQIPANTWTTIRQQFTGSGVAGYVTSLDLVADTDPGFGILTKFRHSMVIANPSGNPVDYFDGNTTDTATDIYSWTGTVNASTSTYVKTGGPTGVKGFVSSMAPYTANDLPNRTRDDFASGIWAPGDFLFNAGSAVLDMANGLIRFGQTGGNPTLVLGSLCPVGASYTLEFEMRFTILPTDLTTHAGIFLGKPDDNRYQFQAANVTGGMHFVMRANGNMQMYKHDAGVTTGISLAGPQLTTVAAGQWLKFRVIVTPTTLSMQRIDAGAGGAVALTSSDTAYRGRYLGLARNYGLAATDGAGTVEFRNVIVT